MKTIKTNKGIHIYSEIGKLKTVLLHRPGLEIENFIPELLQKLSFDGIPYLKIAQKEHDFFANLLRQQGVEVLYFEKLLGEVLIKNEKLRLQFIDSFLAESDAHPAHLTKLKKYLLSFPAKKLPAVALAGLETYKLGLKHPDDYPLILDPLPNVLFQRDLFASLYDGVVLNKMSSKTRKRETLFSSYFLKYHSRFKDRINFYYDRHYSHPIEGGDVMVLNANTLIIGTTQSTKMEAILDLAKNLYHQKKNSKLKIIVIDIKLKKRVFMHLDTVLTNVDYDKFLIHPLVFDHLDQFKIYEIDAHGKKETSDDLLQCLEKILQHKVTFIRCGGDSPIAANREQWNDGTNVLTISPGKVISYDRNHVTNKLLRKVGIEVYEIPSSELSQGRGGPRCMSMPIWREDLPK